MSAPLRIRRSLSRAQRAALPSTPSPDPYAGRLLKLIPAEAIALYLAGRGVISADESSVAGLSVENALLIWSLLGLAAVIGLRIWTTGDREQGEPPQWIAVGIAAVSYVIWLYSLGDVFPRFGAYDPKLGALLVILWTFGVPFFYRGARPRVEVLPPG